MSQVNKSFTYQGKLTEISQEEYNKNWHIKIKSKEIVLDVVASDESKTI